MNKIENAINDLDDLKSCDSISSSHFKDVHGKHLDLAITALTEKLNGGWIKCNERLPEENGNYIVTVEDCLNRRTITEISAWLKSYARFECEDKYQSVIAWQPLPEPYKGEK